MKCPFEISKKLVTLKIAQEMLAYNMRNRRINYRLVNKLATMMRDGRFKEIGDVIRFSDKNEMIDGQHRLLAIIESNKPFWFIVVRGLDPSVKFALDQHQRRTLFQQFTMIGIAHPSVFSSATVLLNAFMNGASQSKNCDDTRRMGQEEATEFYYKHKDKLTAAYARYRQYQFLIKKMLSPSVVVAMMVFVQLKDKNANTYIFNFFEDFFENQAGLTHSASNMPILLRNKIAEEMTTPNGVGVGKINELLLHCIKGYKHDKAVKTLQPPRSNPFKSKSI